MAEPVEALGRAHERAGREHDAGRLEGALVAPRFSQVQEAEMARRRLADDREAFGLEASETTEMEGYIGEYYDTILKRLREMEADLAKDAKKKLPF